MEVHGTLLVRKYDLLISRIMVPGKPYWLGGERDLLVERRD